MRYRLIPICLLAGLMLSTLTLLATARAQPSGDTLERSPGEISASAPLAALP